MNAIWPIGLRNEKNIHVAFLYTCKLEGNTCLEVAASNLYRIFVNGTLLGYGPARAAHGYSRLDSYSLESFAGQDVVLVAEVYSSNVNTYYTVFEQPFFAAEMKCGDRVIACSADFTAYHLTQRVQKVRRFSSQRAFSEIYRMDQDPWKLHLGDVTGLQPIETEPVAMNRLLPRYVTYPKLNLIPGTCFEQGMIEMDASAEPWRDRMYFGIDNVRYLGFVPGELSDDTGNVNQFVYHPQNDCPEVLGAMTYRTYDFCRTLTGFFTLTVTACEDTQLYILFDEVLEKGPYGNFVAPFRSTCSNVIKYTLTAGTYHLMNFEANSARFVTIALTSGRASVEAFGMTLYENRDSADFRFDYGDAELNLIVRAAVNTFAQNAVDVLTDCPSRERAGWLCDSYFTGRAEALFTGKNLVEKSFLENYALYEDKPWLPKGMIPMCYPADHFSGTYIPNWSMWYILELRNYVFRTGDDRMRDISRDKVLGLVAFFEKYENEDGLLENLESWVFIEWSKCNDPEYIAGVNYPSNMLWAAALDAAAELYALPALSEKAASMRAKIRQLAWNGTFYEENAVRNENRILVKTGHTTETGQYYAFYFGVASPETDSVLFEKMRTQFGPARDAERVYPDVYPSNAIVGNYLRLELLVRYGYKSQVLQECKDFFLQMAELTGTLWEHSKLSASLNHGFASMVAVYIDTCADNLKAE